ncbi:MAG: putative Rossmann-fold nucleotide-binding protein, partial [Ulvibacter sp.]
GLLNTNGFYDDLIKLIENMVKKGFVSIENYDQLLVDSKIENLLKKMKNFKQPESPKWLNPNRV